MGFGFRPCRSDIVRAIRIALLCAATASFASELSYPSAPKRPVTDVYHGVSVVDDYRWLEDDNAAEVKDWVDAQNGFTRKLLDGVSQRGEIVRRVQQLLGNR